MIILIFYRLEKLFFSFNFFLSQGARDKNLSAQNELFLSDDRYRHLALWCDIFLECDEFNRIETIENER